MIDTVAYDHQIFSIQRYGGVSRYVCELAARIHRLPGLQARVHAGLHFNEHLAATDVPQSGLFLRSRLPGTDRICRAVNRFAGRRDIAASASIIHQTYYARPPRAWRNVPVVVTVHDMIHELFPGNFAPEDRTSIDKRASTATADHIICVSRSTANDLVRVLGVDPMRISVVHLGMADVFRSEAGATQPPPPVRPYLLYVGQRGGYKNFKGFVRGFAASPMLRAEFDIIAFGSGPFDEEELQLFRALGLRQASITHRTGPDSELARAYRGARAMVYPSLYEGFGIPPLEAMAAGCPVACSSTSSLPEVVADAAVLFDPENPEAMTKALETVASDEAIRARLVKAGTTRAELFSWERCARETAAVYQRLISSRRMG